MAMSKKFAPSKHEEEEIKKKEDGVKSIIFIGIFHCC
jgi:hypothetical protein